MSNRNILLVNASAAKSSSFSRRIAQTLVQKLGGTVTERDVAEALPAVTEAWIEANYTDPDERTANHKAQLSLSDELVDELIAADTVVIGAPIYNFSIPASLKLWIDLVARVGRTFKYTENGPVGLLEGKKAYVVVASGGVPLGSPVDFNSPYLKQVLAFIGITDVEFIHVSSRSETAIEDATATVEKLAA